MYLFYFFSDNGEIIYYEAEQPTTCVIKNIESLAESPNAERSSPLPASPRHSVTSERSSVSPRAKTKPIAFVDLSDVQPVTTETQANTDAPSCSSTSSDINNLLKRHSQILNEPALKRLRANMPSTNNGCQEQILKTLQGILNIQRERLELDRQVNERLREQVRVNQQMMEAQKERLQVDKQMIEGVNKLVSTFLVGTILDKVNL